MKRRWKNILSHDYEDLYIKAQNNDKAKYHIFTFDLVGSKAINKIDPVAENRLQDIIIELYLLIASIERMENRKILVFEDGFIHGWDLKRTKEFGLKYEPFFLGDAVGFTIYNNSLDTQEVINAFNLIKEKHDFPYDIHYNDALYETNDYGKGGIELFRGYCIDISSNIHKDEYKELRDKIKTRKERK